MENLGLVNSAIDILLSWIYGTDSSSQAHTP